MDQGKATGSPTAEIVTPASSLPWQWHPRSAKAAHEGSIYRMERPGHAYAIAMQPRYVENKQFSADAAFIVHAVNSHAALMNALYMARGQLVTLGGDAQDLYADRIHKYVLDTINSAIAAASSSSGPLMTDDSSRKDSGEVNQ